MIPRPLAALITAMTLGVAAEVLGGAWPSAPTVADLATGWILAVCGAIGWWRRPQSRVGPLLLIAAFAWFAGTLATSGVASLAIVGSALLTIHRGPIFHAILGYPTGRAEARATQAVVVLGYAYAAVVPLARNDLATVAAAASLVGTALVRHQTSTGAVRQARVVAVAAATIMAVGLLVGAVGRIVHAGPEAETASSWIYLFSISLSALLLAADVSRARWDQTELSQLVVDLGAAPNAGIRGRLADALGDPSLEVAFWIPESGAYVDELGKPIDLARPRAVQEVTLLEQQGDAIGALIHKPTPLENAALLGEVAAAARLALANVRLEAQVRRHLAELEASRRRIIEATDTERRELQRLVGYRVGPALADIKDLLDRGFEDAKASGNQALAAELEADRVMLETAEHEVLRLAAGLHPVRLPEEGIGPALSALVDHVGLPVRVNVSTTRLAPEIEIAIAFVCSEALTNVRKHAQASQVDLDVHIDAGAVLASVADDGVGGADPSSGSGLSGLIDRVEAIGGVISVDSPTGKGTRVVARIPIRTPMPLFDAMPGLHDERDAGLTHPW